MNELLAACQALLANVATGPLDHNPTAAVSVQFNAGAWQEFVAAVESVSLADPPSGDEPEAA